MAKIPSYLMLSRSIAAPVIILTVRLAETDTWVLAATYGPGGNLLHLLSATPAAMAGRLQQARLASL